MYVSSIFYNKNNCDVTYKKAISIRTIFINSLFTDDMLFFSMNIGTIPRYITGKKFKVIFYERLYIIEGFQCCKEDQN